MRVPAPLGWKTKRMEQSSAARRFAGTNVVVGFLALAVIVGAVVIARPWTWCPSDWSGASRIDLDSGGDVMLDGRPFRVGGNALLDYMLGAGRHPLVVTASIAASSREALGEPVFTCFRVIRGSEIWARRPTTYGTQTAADGYPPGATPPANNEAWRSAVVNDGPEWPGGDQIALELWASVNGRSYVFLLPPFALMKGG